eukprot:scaffold4703_cov108-Cylindrotheca_fusiformis.AAC.7
MRVSFDKTKLTEQHFDDNSERLFVDCRKDLMNRAQKQTIPMWVVCWDGSAIAAVAYFSFLRDSNPVVIVIVV